MLDEVVDTLLELFVACGGGHVASRGFQQFEFALRDVAQRAARRAFRAHLAERLEGLVREDWVQQAQDLLGGRTADARQHVEADAAGAEHSFAQFARLRKVADFTQQDFARGRDFLGRGHG